MSRSWGHELRPISAERRQKFDDYLVGKGTVGAYEDGPDGHAHYVYRDGIARPEWTWCSRRCHNRIEFVFVYNYVTGRAGRVSYAEKEVCREHAEKAAKKYGIAMPREDLTHA